MTTANLYEYRAVLHLNNAAVSLLRRACYRQAMGTFSDAFACVKAITAKDQAGLEPIDRQWIDERLAASYQRLANPQPSQKNEGHLLDFEVLSDHESPRTVQVTGPSRNEFLAHLVHIDSDDFHGESCFDITVESAIILYNFGIAYRCLASLETSQPFAPSVNQGASHLLNLAYGAAMNCQRQDQFEDTSSQFNRIMLLGQLTLHHLADLSRHCPSVYNSYMNGLAEVRRCVQAAPAIPQARGFAPAA